MNNRKQRASFLGNRI